MRRFDLTAPIDHNEVYRLARALEALWVRPGMLPMDGDYISSAQMRAMLRYWRGAEMWPAKVLPAHMLATWKGAAVATPEPTAEQLEAIAGYWKRASVKRGKLWHTVVEIAGIDGRPALHVTLARKRRVTKWIEE